MKSVITEIKRLQKKLKHLDIPFEYQYEFNKILLRTIKNKKSDLKYLFEDNNFIPVILTIKYPNITIRNSRDESKYLGDIYALFSITPLLESGVKPIPYSIRLIHVLRSEYSYKDLFEIEPLKPGSSLYTHSHILPTLFNSNLNKDNNEFYNFYETLYLTSNVCLGSSILANKTKFTSLEEFPQIFIYYKKFFEWESVEGHPYNEFTKKAKFLDFSEGFKLSNLLVEYINSNNIKKFINHNTIDDLDTIIYNAVYFNGITLNLDKEHLKTIVKDLDIYNINLLHTDSPFDIGNYDYIIEKNYTLNFKNRLLKSKNLGSIIESFRDIGIIFKKEIIYPSLKVEDDVIDLKNDINELNKFVDLIISKFGINGKLKITLPLNKKYIIRIFVANIINNLIKINEFYV